MAHVKNYHPRLDPDSRYYGLSEAEYDERVAKWFAEEGAYIQAMIDERKRRDWAELTALWNHKYQVWDRQRAKDERTFFETYGREPTKLEGSTQ